MDCSAILQELNKASLFDLHRLQSVIYQELSNPTRLDQIKARLKTSQLISCFDSQSNRLINDVILKIQRTRCLVININKQKAGSCLFITSVWILLTLIFNPLKMPLAYSKAL